MAEPSQAGTSDAQSDAEAKVAGLVILPVPDTPEAEDLNTRFLGQRIEGTFHTVAQVLWRYETSGTVGVVTNWDQAMTVMEREGRVYRV